MQTLPLIYVQYNIFYRQYAGYFLENCFPKIHVFSCLNLRQAFSNQERQYTRTCNGFQVFQGQVFFSYFLQLPSLASSCSWKLFSAIDHSHLFPTHLTTANFSHYPTSQPLKTITYYSMPPSYLHHLALQSETTNTISPALEKAQIGLHSCHQNTLNITRGTIQ